MKKGQGAQFNWIFILVAGIIVMGFFSVFIFKYIELENKKASFRIVRNFNENLNLLETSSVFGGDLIKLGIVTKIDFTCAGDDSLITVNNEKELTLNLGDKIVFAPNSVRDKNLGGWVYEWNYPFLVTKFLYLTSSKFKYIIVGNNEEVNKIPEVFNIEKVSSVSEIKDPSNTKVIFFSEQNNAEELINRYSGLEVIYIDATNKKVKFYNSNEEFDYFGEAFLYGAIFSGNSDNYKCAMNSALKRLSLISRIYSGKIYLLNLVEGSECRSLSGLMDGGLNAYKNYIGEGSLDSIMTGLKEQNLELHGRGCTAVF